MFPSYKIVYGFAASLLLLTTSAAPVNVAATKRDGVAPAMDGAPVVFGSGTYPRANKLANGNIIGAYTAFNGGDNIIETVLSTDNGQSWYVV